MKAFASFSGGKESILACHCAREMGIDVQYLVNMSSEDGERCRSHGVNAELLRLQSRALGIPIVQKGTTWGNYEGEFKKIISLLKKEGIEAGIFGDIDIQDHRDWVERVCRELEVEPVLPLWGRSREELLSEFIQTGFEAVVVTTQANSLGKGWLNRRIDEKFIADLKNVNGVDLCGEQGEYHTLVVDGPLFHRKIQIITFEKVRRENHWFLDILQFGLEER